MRASFLPEIYLSIYPPLPVIYNPDLDRHTMSRRLPQCGAPDLTTFKAATSSDEQRAMHAEPEVPGA
jgi:hypothetical protein